MKFDDKLKKKLKDKKIVILFEIKNGLNSWFLLEWKVKKKKEFKL